MSKLDDAIKEIRELREYDEEMRKKEEELNYEVDMELALIQVDSATTLNEKLRRAYNFGVEKGEKI